MKSNPLLTLNPNFTTDLIYYIIFLCSIYLTYFIPFKSSRESNGTLKIHNSTCSLSLFLFYLYHKILFCNKPNQFTYIFISSYGKVYIEMKIKLNKLSSQMYSNLFETLYTTQKLLPDSSWKRIRRKCM